MEISDRSVCCAITAANVRYVVYPASLKVDFYEGYIHLFLDGRVLYSTSRNKKVPTD